jgi:hypothetical protein
MLPLTDSTHPGPDTLALRAALDSGIVKKLPDVELPMDDGLIPSETK